MIRFKRKKLKLTIYNNKIDKSYNKLQFHLIRFGLIYTSHLSVIYFIFQNTVRLHSVINNEIGYKNILFCSKIKTFYSIIFIYTNLYIYRRVFYYFFLTLFTIYFYSLVNLIHFYFARSAIE